VGRFNVPGHVQRERHRLAEKELHRCQYCGHDGGRETVAKQAEVLGYATWACIDVDACRRRLRRLHAEAGVRGQTRFGNRAW